MLKVHGALMLLIRLLGSAGEMQYITGTLYRRLTAPLLLSEAGRNHRGGYKAVRASVGFWEPFHRWPPPGWRAVESGRVGGLKLRANNKLSKYLI